MSTVHPMSPTTRESLPAEQLFKPDHPRRIDRVIDYFGSPVPPGDPCGEDLLDALSAHDDDE
jgi:hypothetical protein